MLIITRTQWGARYSDGFGPAPVPSEWWLHHSGGPAPDPADEASIVRILEQTGQTRFGGGISYTWLVPPSGRAYVGHSMNRQGAHTKNRNDRSRGICLIGNYSGHRPTSVQLNAVAEIMVTEWRAGRARTYLLNGGHRDLQATECPGDHAYALIPEINRRAQALVKDESNEPTSSGGIVIPVSLPRTEAPKNPDSPKSTWPQREETINLGYPGGVHGWLRLRLSAGHPGGYLYRAHVDYPGKPTKVLSWIEPAKNQSHDLLPAYRQDREYVFTPEPGPGTLMLTYSAPGGASLSLEWEK